MNNLHLPRYPFRIVAPETAKGAALKKNSGSDVRPIVNREMLDIKKTSCFHAAASSILLMRVKSVYNQAFFGNNYYL